MRISKLEFFDLEERVLNNLPDNCYYHGSNNISWFEGVEDIDTYSNTKNAKSEYFFMSPDKRTALNYSIDSEGMDNLISDDSGVICFKIKKGYNGYKLTQKDIKDASNHYDIESVYDNIKIQGYDYVINTIDGKNIVVLNKECLYFVDKIYNKNSLSLRENFNILKIIQEEIQSFFKEGEGFLKEEFSKEDFYKQLNIDPDDLSHMGRGDFGDAYSIGDGRVLKITTSKNECELAKELVNNSDKYSGFADIYWVGMVEGTCYIVMEELDEDSSVEDMYYQLESYLSEEGLPIQYVHMLDTDELDLEEDMIDFISDIEDINRSYRMLGIEASDIKPDNMGYDKNGKLKAFDIDDRNR